ncbi:aminomethyltransferase family protein [Dasania marina]|uniref:aminomethyltransferase family protein n=1 Tax=Dasania marina TaxID=471499 RepID=UPI0030DBE635|tara:strand:+ start:7881 stop:9026 length:1146 start_codon:yes stop_codon:yes gene_type:complete
MPAPLKLSPFYDLHNSYSAEVEWDNWGGFATALKITDLDKELKAVRSNAVMFDMTPVVKYRIKGPDALAYMNKMTTRQMDIDVGRVTYTCWCNEQGKVIDDGTAFRIADDEYILMPGSNRQAYFEQLAAGMDLQVSDITLELAALTVQGKKSLTMIQALGVQGLEKLKPFRFDNYESIAGTIRISRTGFFGDLGYELWLDYSQAESLWNGLVQAGITPCGLDTLCNARLEAGLIIPEGGFEFEPIDPIANTSHDFNRSPFELDLGFLVDFKKPDFIGRAALLAESENGFMWHNVGLEIEDTTPAEHGNKVMLNGIAIGFVTSGLYSVSLEKNIALATIKATLSEIGRELEVMIANQIVNATIVNKPFVNPERKSQTPAPAL